MSGRIATVGLALASTALCLAALEVAVRALGLAPAVHPIDTSGEESVFQLSSDPLLGFELKPNYRNDHADFAVTYPRTNAHGQRDIERTVEKPPGTRRILVLGDSVVEGSGIEDLDDTISRWLERLYGDESVEVLNFGVSGYCTRAEVELLEVKGLAFEPDVVIVVFVANDFDNFNRQLVELGSAIERPAAVKSLFLASHLFRVLAIEFDWFHFGLQVDPMRRNSEAIGDNNVVEGLARLRELADRHGFEPVVAIWPEFTDTGIVNLHPMPGDGDTLVVERLAAANGIPSVRLSEYFERDRARRRREVNPRLFYTNGDRMHPSPRGARVAAQGLKDALPGLIAAERAPSGRAAGGAAARVAQQKGGAVPNYAIVYSNTGNKLVEQKKYLEAIAQYQRAIEVDPSFAKAHNNLGNVQAILGDREAALESYRRAVELDPEYVDARYNLAGLLVETGSPEQAVEHYRALLERRPDLASARQKLADLLLELGRGDEAVELWSRELERRPHSRVALEGLENVRRRAQAAAPE